MEYHELKNLMRDSEEWGKIVEKTKFLDSHYSKVPARQRMWHIDRNNFTLVECHTCHAIGMGFSNKSKTYARYCNSACSQLDPKQREKAEATCLKKFGAKSNLCLSENKAKEEATKILKYGAKNYLQTDAGKDIYKKHA